jgi:glyoxylase-like metal-dependent hydrolase (beta-lactamase superfamily II)
MTDSRARAQGGIGAGAVAIGPGLVRIPVMGKAMINCYVVDDGKGSLTLIDTGLGRSRARVERGIGALGAELGDVDRIVITHAHPDHAGSMAALARATEATVFAHEADRAFLTEGEAAPSDNELRLGRMANRLPIKFEPIHQVHPVREGEQLDADLTVVYLPGHTPGHIGLMHHPSDTLIVADGLFHIRNVSQGPRPLCTDVSLARESAQRLADMDFGAVAFGHGAELHERDAVDDFLRRHRS